MATEVHEMSKQLDASKVLEAALEQMDDIIAATSLELKNGSLDIPMHSTCKHSDNEAINSKSSHFPLKHSTSKAHSSQYTNLKHMLEELSRVVKVENDSNDNHSLKDDDLDILVLQDIFKWLQKMLVGTSGGTEPPTHSGDTSGIQKIRQLEIEKKNLMLQVSVLNDQVDAQADKIRELEAMLEDRKEQLRHMDQTLHQEVMTRSAIENSKLEMMTEISSLRLRLTASERDRKDSDERCRKIEGDLQVLYNRLAVGDTNGEHSSLRFKISRNGTLLSSSDRNSDVEKMRVALEAVMASNEEKDKKIEDLRLAVIKYKKLQDFVLSGHQRKASDISLKDGQLCDAEVCKDMIPPPSPGSESIKSLTQIKFPGKPPSGHRAPFTSTSAGLKCDAHCKESIASLCSHSTINSECRSLKNVQSIHKSNSLENVRHTSPKASSPKNPYGTIPRQSGPQALQHLQEQLQNFECSATMPVSKVHASEAPCQTPILSNASGKQSIKDQGKEVNRGFRNKSTGVSFGKGFFKLRSGKRSSSAPELGDGFDLLDSEATISPHCCFPFLCLWCCSYL